MRTEIAHWSPEPGVDVCSCCTVPTDPGLVIYGDSVGGLNVLRLFGGS